MYEKRFKVGDKVKCIPGYSVCSGGLGYVSDKEFIIGEITYYSNGEHVLWPKGGDGVLIQSVKLCDPLSPNMNIKQHIFKFW